jgi:hypothetical protein
MAIHFSRMFDYAPATSYQHFKLLSKKDVQIRQLLQSWLNDSLGITIHLIKFKRNFPIQTVWRAASVCFRPSVNKFNDNPVKLINRYLKYGAYKMRCAFDVKLSANSNHWRYIETDKNFQHDTNFHDRFAIGLVVDLRHCRNDYGRRQQCKKKIQTNCLRLK